MHRLIICPHCITYMLIKNIKIGLFRHAMFIDGTNCQHLTKEELDSYMELNIILGCGKPLQSFVNRSGILFVDKYFDPL